jgi:hypothetical protein
MISSYAVVAPLTAIRRRQPEEQDARPGEQAGSGLGYEPIPITHGALFIQVRRAPSFEA